MNGLLHPTVRTLMDTHIATAWLGELLAGERYRVERELGEGGMGSVLLARDLKLESDVVIKVPHAHLLRNADCIERFQREVRSLVRLAHPHVVRIIDVGERQGQPFAVMQYLGGGSLEDQRDAKRRMPIERLSGWLPQIAAALDFIHRQGFVHRDVKPANILFDEHGFPFLGDFGVAKALEATADHEAAQKLTGTGFVLGTPHYMAPELIMGSDVDGRVDQYALAVMCHELIAGSYPIDAPNPTALLVQQTTTPPVRLETVVPGIPAALSAAVWRGLSKSPGDRYATCEQFAAEMMGALQGTAPGASTAAALKADRLRCPHCGKALKLGSLSAEKVLGKTVRCQACNTPFRATEEKFETVSQSAKDTVSTQSFQLTQTAPRPAALVGHGGRELPTTALQNAELAYAKAEARSRERTMWMLGAGGTAAAAILIGIVVVLWPFSGGDEPRVAEPQTPLVDAASLAKVEVQPEEVVRQSTSTEAEERLPSERTVNDRGEIGTEEHGDLASGDKESKVANQPEMTGEVVAAPQVNLASLDEKEDTSRGAKVVADEVERVPVEARKPASPIVPVQRVELPTGRVVDAGELFRFDFSSFQRNAERSPTYLRLPPEAGRSEAWVAQDRGKLNGVTVVLHASDDPSIVADFNNYGRRNIRTWDESGLPLFLSEHTTTGRRDGLRCLLKEGDLRVVQEYKNNELVVSYLFDQGKLVTTIEGNSSPTDNEEARMWLEMIESYDASLVEDQRELVSEVDKLFAAYQQKRNAERSKQARQNISGRENSRRQEVVRQQNELSRRARGQ